jgi:hypothetical protein
LRAICLISQCGITPHIHYTIFSAKVNPRGLFFMAPQTIPIKRRKGDPMQRRMRYLRLKYKIPLKEIAACANVSPQRLSQVELQARHNPHEPAGRGGFPPVHPTEARGPLPS